MDKLLKVLCIFFLCSCTKQISWEEKVTRDGLVYEINSQTPYSGNYFQQFPGGSKERGSYQDGKATGIWEIHHENGQLESRGTYEDGERVGTWENYHSNGQFASKQLYENGKKVGVSESYHNNGQLKERGTYEDGKMVGTWKNYFRSGKLKSETIYKDGEEVSWEIWTEKGELMSHGYVKNGKYISLE